MRIGVLAVQGAFAEHIAMIGRLNAQVFPVRLPEELGDVEWEIPNVYLRSYAGR